VDALLAALRGEEVTHILITHTHLDHSPAAAPIKAALGVESYGFGPHGGGRHAPGEQIEEGGDPDFVPDVTLAHGDIVEGVGWSVECVHTPGHTSNHLCFQLREEKALFSGDHVMGWSTSIVSPPDGDMADYLASLRLLLERDDDIYWPTHGPSIGKPQPFVRAFIGHRKLRERQILRHLKAGEGRIAGMVPLMYRDIPQALHRAAERSVFAHLIHMCETGRAACEGELAVDARYRAA
jgi:glyoxylase-like metal-dependent hydrolase (beta-lactamase superfamily II)